MTKIIIRQLFTKLLRLELKSYFNRAKKLKNISISLNNFLMTKEPIKELNYPQDQDKLISTLE